MFLKTDSGLFDFFAQEQVAACCLDACNVPGLSGIPPIEHDKVWATGPHTMLSCTRLLSAVRAVWSALSTQCTVNLEHSNALSTQCTRSNGHSALSASGRWVLSLPLNGATSTMLRQSSTVRCANFQALPGGLARPRRRPSASSASRTQQTRRIRKVIG